MKVITFVILMLIAVSANSASQCSEVEDFKTSIYGMLQTTLLPIKLESPENDAYSNFQNSDFRLLGYGNVGGIEIPGSIRLKLNEICLYGVRVVPGVTDAYESSEHRLLAEELKAYIKTYNAALLTLLGR